MIHIMSMKVVLKAIIMVVLLYYHINHLLQENICMLCTVSYQEQNQLIILLNKNNKIECII